MARDSARSAFMKARSASFARRPDSPACDAFRWKTLSTICTKRSPEIALFLRGRFLLCNRRDAQQFYWAKFLFGDRQVFVFNFSFEITAARLNFCDGPSLYLEIDSF